LIALATFAVTVSAMHTFEEQPAGIETDTVALSSSTWHAVPDADETGPQRAALGQGRALVVVRESNIYDWLAFATMIRQVLQPLIGLVPGVERVLRLTGQNAEVMRNDPDGLAVRLTLRPEPVYQQGRPYGWVFEVDGTIFFFAMTSAFISVGEDLQNHFTEDLIGLLLRHRPDALVTGPSTRLVRRKDLGEQLGRQVGLLKVRVFTKETPEGLDPSSPTGSLHWSWLCQIAEMDLRYTITRLLTGRIHHVRNGGWLAGTGSLPLGFVLDDPETKRPVVGDADDVRLARRLLKLAYLAAKQLELREEERTLDPGEIVRRLSSAGATKRSNKRSTKNGTRVAGTPLASVSDPRATLIGLLSSLPAYSAAGKLTRMQGLPMVGLTRHDVHGHTIYKQNLDDPEEKGHIRFEWNFPKPVSTKGKPVPWAAEKTLAGAARYLQHLLDTAPDNPPVERVWPMAGIFTAQRDGDSYRLDHTNAGYRWRVEGRTVGKFDGELLVHRFVNAAIAALDELGIDPATVPLEARSPSTPKPVEGLAELEDRRAALEEQLEAALQAVRETISGRQHASHQKAANALETQLEELEELIRERQTQAVHASEPAEQLLVGDLATLLSVLKDTAGRQVPPEVCNHVRRLVTGGTIDDCWDPSATWGNFRAQLAIPRATGFSRQIPISFEVGNTSQGRTRSAFWEQRMPEVLKLRMTTPISIDELAGRLGGQPSPMRVAKNLHDAIRPLFAGKGLPPDAASVAAAAAIDCPDDSTRLALWAMLHDEPLPETVEDLDAEETALHLADLRESWLSGRWRTPAWSKGGERRRRQMQTWVADHSSDDPEAGAPALDLAAAFGYSAISALNDFLHDPGREPDGKARVLERTCPWPSGAFIDPSTGDRQVSVPDEDKRVRLRPCPHCGHRRLNPLVAVDTWPDSVVCLNCGCQPSKPEIKRPRSRRMAWEGPYGRGRDDDRGARDKGARRGTALGEATPAPPSAGAEPPPAPAPRKKRRPQRPARPCAWQGCTRLVDQPEGKGRPPIYCGEDGHTSRDAIYERQRAGQQATPQSARKKRRRAEGPRLCAWQGCTRPARTLVGRGRPPTYCGEDGHTTAEAAIERKRTRGSG